MTNPIRDGATEFGGWPGRVQPEPHDILDVPYEQLNLAVRSDPSDATSNASTVRAREQTEAEKRLSK